MASRKRKLDESQIGLGLDLPSTSTPASLPTSSEQALGTRRGVDGGLGPSPGLSLPPRPEPMTPQKLERADDGGTADLDLDELDDYDDSALHNDVPRIRLADAPRDAPTVIVEAVGPIFEVSRLRDNGTTVACVMWTRAELEELQRRITAALEM